METLLTYNRNSNNNDFDSDLGLSIINWFNWFNFLEKNSQSNRKIVNNKISFDQYNLFVLHTL